MRILVACECYGVVRDAFIRSGHDAWSCDLKDTRIPGPHIKGDVLDHLDDGWDLMIGHPPCTYLSYAGTRHWNKPGRLEKRLEALHFFAALWEAPIQKICLENPKSCASPTIAKYTQVIQPYYFGDSHMKTTWLWLKSLPILESFPEKTLFNDKSFCEKPEPISIDKTTRQKKRYFSDAKIRCPEERSKTFPGIAWAMADQWGNL